MSRLPVPGSDDNVWGDILNDFLGVSLAGDGTVNTGVVGTAQLADAAVTGVKIANGTITSTNISGSAGIVKAQLASTVQASLTSADTALQSIPAATSGALGAVQLAGDLGGTATAPTVPTKLSLSGGTMTGILNVPGIDTVVNTASLSNKVISPNTNQLIQSPVSGLLWHDVFAFNRAYTTTYETSADATTWSTGSLDTTLFAQKEDVKISVIAGATQRGSRWTWHDVSWNTLQWIVISFAYSAPAPSTSILVESSADGTTWTTRHTSAATAYNANPYWFYVNNFNGDVYLRLTILTTGLNTGNVSLTSIKGLTARMGDQGLGREFSFPYTWTNTGWIGINKGTTLPSYALDVNGAVNVAGQIHNVTDPTAAQDAATKNYVDTQTANAGITRSVNLLAANTTAAAVANKDYVYYWSGSSAYTLTMPTAASNTNRYTLKNASSVSQTVATTSSQTIEGTTTITIAAGNSVDLISNGSGWMVI